MNSFSRNVLNGKLTVLCLLEQIFKVLTKNFHSGDISYTNIFNVMFSLLMQSVGRDGC